MISTDSFTFAVVGLPGERSSFIMLANITNVFNMAVLLVMLFSSIFSWFLCPVQVLGKVRSRRFLWVTHDRRLIFPPGTVLNLKPTLQIPFLRKDEPPDGIHSDIQISWFFYIIFNELGITHASHPWPPFYPFGTLFGPSKRSACSRTKEESDCGHNKFRRPIMSLPSPDQFPGGERAVIYPRLEQLLSSFGWKGRSCLLRIVCETHEYPLKYGYGLLGELFTLFFTVSQSPFAESHLLSYLQAEELGKSGNCSNFFENCDKSLFRWEKGKEIKPLKIMKNHSQQNSIHNDIFIM